jgi:hypothetical protein
MKEKFERIQTIEEDQLFEGMEEALGNINYDELNRTFRAWVQGIQGASEGIRGHLRY